MVAAVVLIACSPLVVLTLMSIRAHRDPESNWHCTRGMRWIELAVAWFLGLIFLSGGMSKLMPFPGVIGPVWLEEELSKYDLGMFAVFIAWSEAIIGLLLLTKPTRVLGAIMLVPLVLNILMVTVSMQWRGTPWVITFFLVANVFLLVFHYPRWRPIVDPVLEWLDSRQPDRAGIFRRIVLASGILVLVGPLLHIASPWIAVISILLGMIGLLWGEYGLRFRGRRES